jgi:hypothetical protein
MALPSVDATIHLHDQPQRGRDEVSDVAVPDDNLTPKRHTPVFKNRFGGCTLT